MEKYQARNVESLSKRDRPLLIGDHRLDCEESVWDMRWAIRLAGPLTVYMYGMR